MEKTVSLAQTVPPSTRRTMNDDVSESAKSSLPSKRNEDDMSEIKMSSSTTDDNDCPLFMDGLQSNFAQNSALAALASLLDEEDDENNNDDDADIDISTDADLKKSFEQSSTSLSSPARTTHVSKSGGGKASKVTPRRNNYNPYSKGNKEKGRNENEEKKKKGATLGEAQLFLNMWKL